jgi:hypothetical protein
MLERPHLDQAAWRKCRTTHTKPASIHPLCPDLHSRRSFTRTHPIAPASAIEQSVTQHPSPRFCAQSSEVISRTCLSDVQPLLDAAHVLKRPDGRAGFKAATRQEDQQNQKRERCNDELGKKQERWLAALLGSTLYNASCTRLSPPALHCLSEVRVCEPHHIFMRGENK